MTGKRAKRDDPEQSRLFIEKAQELGADTKDSAADAVLNVLLHMRPQYHREDQGDPRDKRLDDPHVRSLMELVWELRKAGLDTPSVDPNDGGKKARALFLLESPGPKAVGTKYISRDNPDQSARNMGKALESAGFQRKDVVLWNVVPQCVSSVDKNKRVSSRQIREAAPYTQKFIDKLENLRVVVFCGSSAKKALRYLKIPASVKTLQTYHPGAKAYNKECFRAHLLATFREAHNLIAR